VVKDLIKVVFLENYGVSLAERMIPAADVSEQISTASKEASGTGNMKFMMNGAVTIGTLDGANVEIRDAVGNENIYIFGLTSDEVYQLHHDRNYSAQSVYDYHAQLRRILDQLTNGFFDDVPHDEFRTIVDSLLKHNDEFLVLKDFDAYVRAQERLSNDFRNGEKWNRMTLTNIAKSGIFSSDYTIKEYAQQIWKL
jgi:starch phosphorylase